MVEKTVTQQLKELQQAEGGHIFYYSNDLDCYIQNAVSYIVSGVEQGEQILMVENDKIYSLIQEKVKKLLNREQLKKVHFINNFDFYWQHGDFHPPTVLAFFSKILGPHLENNQAIRAWGHVEWRDEKCISENLEDFEREANEIISTVKVWAVCAYDADRVSESLKAGLMRTHEFYMTDDRIVALD